MKKLLVRLVGEWKAINDCIRTTSNIVKYVGGDFIRSWRDWRDERPYRKCTECKQWLPDNAVYENGLCLWCADKEIPYEVRRQQWIDSNDPQDEDNVWF